MQGSQQPDFPSNLEQTRVYFCELRSLTRKLLILLHSQAPHLTYKLGSYFYSITLQSFTTTTTVAITYIAYYYHVTPQGISNYEIYLAIASCMHCHDQLFACI